MKNDQMSFKVGTTSPPPQAGLRRDLGANGTLGQGGQQVRIAPGIRSGDRIGELSESDQVRNARSPSLQSAKQPPFTRPAPRTGSPSTEYDRNTSVESRLSAMSGMTRKLPGVQVNTYTTNAQANQYRNNRPSNVPPQWKDLVGSAGQSAPSEASSSVGFSAYNAGEVERMPLEDRIRRIETSLEERLAKMTQESMSVSVTLTKAVEDRMTQRFQELRNEMLQQGSAGGNFQEVSALRTELFDSLSKSVGQEFSNLRLELAARGVPVMAGLPADMESIEQGGGGGPQQTRKTGIAGLVSVISDCVIEKVKEEQCIRNVSEQHEELKSAIKELRSMPFEKMSLKSSGGNSSKNADFDTLHSQVQEMIKVCYSLALELSSEREQRNHQFSDAAIRLKTMEEAMTTSRPSGASMPSKTHAQRQDRPGVGLTLEERGFGKTRIGQLDELMARSLTPAGARSASNISASNKTVQSLNSPQYQRRQPRDSSLHSHGSTDTADTASQDWSNEVRALRSRLENIFHIGGDTSTSSAGLGTGSTGLSGTVGSLPVVEESVPP